MKPDRATHIRLQERYTPVRATTILGHAAQYARAIVIATALMYLAGLFGHFHWFADLFANFVPHLSALTFGCLVILVFARWPRWAIGAGALFAAELITLAPYLIGNDLKADTTGAGAKLRVLQFNVGRQNQDWQNFAEWIRPRVDSFDIIVLLENTPSWAAVIKGLSNKFPAHVQVSRTDSYGIAVFSRLPGSRFTLHNLGTDRVPAVELNARLGGRRLTAIAAHTYAPIGRMMSDRRNAQLQEVAEWIVTAPPGHKVLLGDLNLTPFSPRFRHLLKATGLSDAQNGLGLLPTWAPNVFPTTFGLPIDHTLISDTLSVSYRTCNERFGSDHCPVVTELMGIL